MPTLAVGMIDFREKHGMATQVWSWHPQVFHYPQQKLIESQPGAGDTSGDSCILQKLMRHAGISTAMKQYVILEADTIADEFWEHKPDHSCPLVVAAQTAQSQDEA
jgi:hypothetical protein